ncbi:MAG: 50S ribosomal protein L16 [Candidatus Shapirobacteria bacterium]|jgi:large subunit ribosomal protein L16
MLQPSRTKYRKQFRGKMRGLSKGNLVAFGEYGLKSLDCSWITANQLESARRAIAHATKRNGRIWIRIFPDKPITEKGTGTMGAGKGDVKGYVAVIKPGRIMFEVSGITETEAKEALKLAAAKLPVKCKIVNRK